MNSGLVSAPGPRSASISASSPSSYRNVATTTGIVSPSLKFLRLAVIRAGKSMISSNNAGSTGLSRNSACATFVFPDSFFPTRQVTSGSTVNSSESSADR